MALIKVTKADILKTQNVNPGWFQCQVVKVHPPTKAKESNTINYVFDCKIIEGLGQEKEGKEIAARFNSALIGKMDPFFFSCTGNHMTEDGVDTEECLGKKFDGKIVQTNYNGVMYDNFDSFLPFGSSQNVPF